MVDEQKEYRRSILDSQGHSRRAGLGRRSDAGTRADLVLDPCSRIFERTALGRILGFRRRRLLAQVDGNGLALDIAWRGRSSGITSFDQKGVRVFLESHGRTRSVVASAEVC